MSTWRAILRATGKKSVAMLAMACLTGSVAACKDNTASDGGATPSTHSFTSVIGGDSLPSGEPTRSPVGIPAERRQATLQPPVSAPAVPRSPTESSQPGPPASAAAQPPVKAPVTAPRPEIEIRIPGLLSPQVTGPPRPRLPITQPPGWAKVGPVPQTATNTYVGPPGP